MSAGRREGMRMKGMIGKMGLLCGVLEYMRVDTIDERGLFNMVCFVDGQSGGVLLIQDSCVT